MFSHSLFSVHLWPILLWLIWGFPFFIYHLFSTPALCTSNCTHFPWLISFTLTIFVINHMLRRMKSLCLAQIPCQDFNSKTSCAGCFYLRVPQLSQIQDAKDEYIILLPNLFHVPGFPISIDDTNIYLFTYTTIWQSTLNPLSSHLLILVMFLCCHEDRHGQFILSNGSLFGQKWMWDIMAES